MADIQVTFKDKKIELSRPSRSTHHVPKDEESVNLRVFVDYIRSELFPAELELEMRLPDSPSNSYSRMLQLFPCKLILILTE